MRRWRLSVWWGKVLVCAAGWLAALSPGCGVIVFPLDRAAEIFGGHGDQSGASRSQGAEQALAVALTADRYQLFDPTGPEGQASLHVLPLGGEPPYRYDWYVLDPAGERADHLLDTTDSAEVRFTAAATGGPYQVFCTVTDARGDSDTSSLVLQVGTSVGLDLTSNRFGVIAGGGEFGRAVLHLNPHGGTPPYEVTWTVTAPDGKPDHERLDLTDPFAPVFVSGDELGTYIVSATVIDATGSTWVESIIVVVGQHLGVDVTSARTSVLPGGGSNGMTRLLATPIGGKEPYTYDWEVIGPDGELHNELLWDTTVRSPIFESGDENGSHITRCAVTDAEGRVMIGSTTIVVGQQLGLAIIADRLTLAPGGGSGAKAVLTADARGGREPITIHWSVTGPDGKDASERLSATDATEVTFTASDAVGTYVVRCTALDAEGALSSDAVTLTVGGALGVVVTADKTSVAAGGSALLGSTQLTTHVYGGATPYSYAWTVTGPTGASEPQRLYRTTIASPTFTSGSVSGTYTLLCTVTDATGAVAVDAVSIGVGQPLDIDVTVDRQVLVSGGGVAGQAQLISTVRGGVEPYTYQWSVISPDGVAEPDWLSSTTSAQPVFTSGSSLGTYRVTLTVTDAEGTTFTDSVELVVSGAGAGGPEQNLSLDVSTDDQIIMSGGGAQGTANVQALVTGGVAPVTYDWTVTDPTGAADSARLDSTTNPTVSFTSAATQGTYRVRCTVTDDVGNVFSDSLQIEVTDAFLLDITASSIIVGPGEALTLNADRTGGVPNFTYDWSCLDSGGNSCGGFANDPQTAAGDVVNTWTAPVALGSCRITCLATDAAGDTFADSVIISVTDAFFLDLTSTDIFVSPGDAVTLTANRTGGSANFTYDWSCLDSGGNSCGGFANDPQTAADDVSNTWTAPATLDTYRITCLATDADGHTFTDSVMIHVTDVFILDVTASNTLVGPGGTTTLTANRTGGAADFTYDWSCLDSGGNSCGGFATDPQIAADDVTNTWTAPAASGTYRLTCLATDANGHSFTDSITVTVNDDFLLDVTADVTHVTPGGVVTLTADQTGGAANFQYVWTAQDSSGTPVGTFAGGVPNSGTVTQTDQPGDGSVTWTALTALGTYRITCVATDAEGQTFTDSVMINVTDAFYLDLGASNTHIEPAATTELTISRLGGTADFTYEWDCRKNGALKGTFTTGSLGADSGRATQIDNGVQVVNDWQAPASGDGTLGTYRITVVGTAGNGLSFTDSVEVVVGVPLSLDLTANDTFVAPSTAVTLTADQTGGETTYDYVWSATDNAGAPAGTFTTGSTGAGQATQNNVAADATNGWSVAAAGTYTITCTVTDNVGQVFTDSSTIVVTLLGVFSLDVTTDKAVVWPGETVNLVADQTGGTAPFDYAWSALDESATPAGTFAGANQNGQAGDVSNTWQAPNTAGAEGTYRIRCTVTDAVGDSFTDTVLVEVSTLTLQNVFFSPSAADTASVFAGAALNAWAGFGDPGQQIVAGLNNPVHPRNVVITITDGDNSITGGTARVTGLDARGSAQSEIINIAASVGGSSSNIGVVPFATVTQIDLFDFNGADPGGDQVAVGVDNKFGLTGVLDAAGDVLYVNEDGTVITAGYTVDAVDGQQGITFAAPPNGARDYIVVFRAR